jgi:cyanophycin synthetase
MASITGTNGKTTTSRMLAHILKTAGHTVGMTSTDGVYIDGRLSVKGDMTGPASARIVLRDPTVDIAVLETARGGLLRSGLAYRHCDVSACLNVSSDHLGLKGIDTLEQLAELKRVVVEVASDTAVLNADDDLCLNMADYTKAEHVCYLTMNPAHALVKEHIQAGGRAVVLEQGFNGDMITLYDKCTHFQLVWTHQIPATMDGKATHNVQNAMFAAALAFSLGKSLDDIRHGLRSFDSSIFQAPGRMNVFDEHPFRVILDYGHNPAAIRSICQLVDRLEVTGRRICVLAAPGDRRDEDIRAIADEATGHFDHYICRADDSLRGRGPAEVPTMLRDQLLANGVDESAIAIVPQEVVSVETALDMGQEGDLLVLFADDVRRSWNQVIHFESGHGDVSASAETKPVNSFVEVDPEAFSLEPGARLVRDERGVRLAREEDND